MPSAKSFSALRGRARRQVAHELARRFLTARPIMVADFAAQVGKSPALVRRLLEEAGVSTGGLMCVGMSEADLAPILSARYQAGSSLDTLSRETGLDRRHVGDLLARQGTALRVRRLESLPADQIPRIVRKYRHGATLRELAELTGFSHSTIRRELLKSGVTLLPPSVRNTTKEVQVVETKDQ